MSYIVQEDGSILRGNFAGDVDPGASDPVIAAATVFRNCFFAHPAPVDVEGNLEGVRLFPGDDTPRTFIECNMVNAKPPPGSTVTSCNTAVIERSVQIGSDDIIVDGIVVATIPILANRVHGRIDPATGDYEYKPTPEDLLVD